MFKPSRPPKPGVKRREAATRRANAVRLFPCCKCGLPGKRWASPEEFGEDSNAAAGSAPIFPFCDAHVPADWHKPRLGSLPLKDRPIQPKRDIWPDA